MSKHKRCQRQLPTLGNWQGQVQALSEVWAGCARLIAVQAILFASSDFSMMRSWQHFTFFVCRVQVNHLWQPLERCACTTVTPHNYILALRFRRCNLPRGQGRHQLEGYNRRCWQRQNLTLDSPSVAAASNFVCNMTKWLVNEKEWAKLWWAKPLTQDARPERRTWVLKP